MLLNVCRFQKPRHSLTPVIRPMPTDTSLVLKQNQLHLFRPNGLRLNSGDDLYVVTLQSQENLHHRTFSYTVEAGILFDFFS